MKYVLIDTGDLIHWLKVSKDTYIVGKLHANKFLKIMGGNFNEI